MKSEIGEKIEGLVKNHANDHNAKSGCNVLHHLLFICYLLVTSSLIVVGVVLDACFEFLIFPIFR